MADSGVISASMLYAHLSCPHRVSMDAHVDPALRDPVNPFVEMLWERGTLYETEVIGRVGQEFLDLSGLHGDDKERATREAIARQVPLIYEALGQSPSDPPSLDPFSDLARHLRSKERPNAAP